MTRPRVCSVRERKETSSRAPGSARVLLTIRTPCVCSTLPYPAYGKGRSRCRPGEDHNLGCVSHRQRQRFLEPLHHCSHHPCSSPSSPHGNETLQMTWFSKQCAVFSEGGAGKWMPAGARICGRRASGGRMRESLCPDRALDRHLCLGMIFIRVQHYSIDNAV